MSIWGGPEGGAEGMWRGIDAVMRDRQMKQTQANADRAFQFQQEQANRAQANADRQYEANRADADNSQANAERQMAQGERRIDLYQQNADREYGLKQDELALKGAAQEWDVALKDEQLRKFQIENERLDTEWRKQKEIEDAKKASGRQQLAMALYRVTGNGGQEENVQYKDASGQMQTIRAKILPQGQREQIFGTDGFFRDVQNVISFKDEKGNTIAALVRPDGTLQTFSPDEQYDVIASGVNKAFADDAMKAIADKRSLGMFREQENIKADAKMRVQKQAQDAMLDRKQMDVFSRQRSYEYRLAAAGEIDQTELDRRLDAIDARERRMLEKAEKGGSGTGTGSPAPNPTPTDKAALEAEKAKLQEIAVKKGGAKPAATEKTVDRGSNSEAPIQNDAIAPKDHLGGQNGKDNPSNATDMKSEGKTEKKSVVPKARKVTPSESAAKLYGADVIARYRRTSAGKSATDADIVAGKHDRNLRKVGIAIRGDGYDPATKSADQLFLEEKRRRDERNRASELEKMLASYDDADKRAVSSARQAYDEAWKEADDYALLNHGQGVIFKDDYKTTRAKKFAELVEKINKDNNWEVGGRSYASSPFGSLAFDKLIADIYGDDASKYLGSSGPFSQKNRRIGQHRRSR